MAKSIKKKVVKHLKADIKSFKHEAAEDRELMRELKHKKEKSHEKEESKKHERKEKKDPKPAYPKGKKARNKEEKVMHEFKTGELHSGSKKGPKVKSRAQAVAIALEEGRKAAAGKKKKK